MIKKRRARIFAFGALAALLAALLPAGLAVGTGGDGGGNDPSIVYLTLGRSDLVTWGEFKQRIESGRRCAASFSASPELLVVTPGGGQLGLVKDGLGVKSSSDGTGDPCGRVEADKGESISIALGSHLDGFLMSAIDLDVELKFNAQVSVELRLDGDPVHSFTFSGSGSDDGPDSGSSDNYRLKFGPDGSKLFDQVVLTPTAGSLSLEGGADGTAKGSLDPNNNSSQFKVEEGRQIKCNEPVTIRGEEVVGVVTMEALGGEGGFDAECEESKNFRQDVTEGEGDEGSLLFAPTGGAPARFTMTLTIANQSIVSEGGQVVSLVMEYAASSSDPGMPLLPCDGTPNLEDPGFFEQPDTGLLPGGVEFACFYGVTLTPTGSGQGTEVWSIYFEDDPNFSFG